MSKEKVYYWSDVANFVDVCYSCTGQNIIEIDNNEYNHNQFKYWSENDKHIMCADCESVDVGTIPPEEVI